MEDSRRTELLVLPADRNEELKSVESIPCSANIPLTILERPNCKQIENFTDLKEETSAVNPQKSRSSSRSLKIYKQRCSPTSSFSILRS